MIQNMKLKFVLVLFLSLFLAKGVGAEQMDKIVAVVNNDIITEGELVTFMKLAMMEQDSETAGKTQEELRKFCLDRMIEDRLILHEAKDQKVRIDESVIEDRVKDLRERAGGETVFTEVLKAEGLSLSELKKKFRNQFMIYTLIQREVKDKVNISPKEVTDYFNEHQDKYMTPETLEVDSIFVTKKESLKKVEAELASGRGFNEVAKTYSEKAGLDKVSRGQLKKELEDVIFKLKLGEYSKPIEVSDGFYIFLAKRRLPTSRESLENVKDAISAELEQAKTVERLKEWVESLKDKAYISIRDSK